MSDLNHIARQLTQYHGSVSAIATMLQCSTDKVYRILRGEQQKDKEQVMIACAEYIMQKRKIEREAHAKMAALNE